MADLRISALTAAASAAGANEIPINEAGTTKKITVTQIATEILPVKAAGSDITTGTDDAKFLTSKALADAAVGKIGAAWADWTPSYSNLTVGDGTVVAKYIQIGKIVHAYYKFTLGSTSSIGSSSSISLPVASVRGDDTTIIGQNTLIDTGTALFIGDCRQLSTTTFRPRCNTVSGSLISSASISATNPFTWTTGDIIEVYMTYEAA